MTVDQRTIALVDELKVLDRRHRDATVKVQHIGADLCAIKYIQQIGNPCSESDMESQEDTRRDEENAWQKADARSFHLGVLLRRNEQPGRVSSALAYLAIKESTKCTFK